MVAEIGGGVLGGQTSLRLGRIHQEIVHPFGSAIESLDHLDIDIRVGKDVAVIPDEQMGRHGLGAVEQGDTGAFGKSADPQALCRLGLEKGVPGTPWISGRRQALSTELLPHTQ